MATWEDGPEYAPLERPDAFDRPSSGPVGLEIPLAPPQAPAAPAERPLFADPTQAVPALADLVPLPPVGRDPEQPFAVVSSVMTAESSAWASAHWAPPQSPPFQVMPSQIMPPTTTAPPTNGHRAPFPPPTAPAPSFPPPTAQAPSFPPPSFPPPTYPPVSGPFPAPGTPQWFAPGGYQPPTPVPVAPSAKAVLAAATPGVLVTLVVGGLIWVLAPVTVVIAFLLTGRMSYGRKHTRTGFLATFGVLAGVGVLTALVVGDGFSQWWDVVAGWACFGSWVMLLATVINVYRALKQGRPDPPPTSAFPAR